MELICYTFQNFNVLPQEIEDSKVQLVVNLDGPEDICVNHGWITLKNCSIRNIVSGSKNWQKYFRIENDEEKNAVLVTALKYGSIKYCRTED